MAKREVYLKWEEFFMQTTQLVAKRSKDPSTQVGALITNNENHIMGTGYNGFPNGLSDDSGLWGKNVSTTPHFSKYLYVVHAEINAIMNSSKTKGCILYCTHHPCNECAKVIVQSGIREVVYLNDIKEMDEFYYASVHILNSCGINVRKYKN